MIKIFPFLLLFLLSINLEAQENEFKLISGVYKSSREFKSGQPSYELIGKIIEVESPSLGVFKGKSSIQAYKFDVTSKEEKKMYNKQIGRIFGFSDGESLYVSSYRCLDCFINEQVYFKVNYIGNKYAYFEAYFPRDDIRGMNGGDEIVVLSLETGKKFPLTKGWIKKNLKEKDSSLYEDFKKEKSKYDVLKQYLIKLDKKY
ncbi:MAG: hypothetical protein R2781_09950 [Flavobacteriaceae bacterium]